VHFEAPDHRRPYTLFSPRRLSRASSCAALLLALCASGCATSIHLPALVDTDVTGSIPQQISPLSSSLDAEDWRRAKGSLAIALDPQGNGARVDWDNPQTDAKGSITAVGDAYARGDRVCRAFVAELGGSVAGPSVQGTGCRDSSGDWSVSDVKPWTR
jgi:surface antigen